MVKPTPVDDKLCAECANTKPLREFDRRGRGYSKSCKDCAGTAVPPGCKRCSRCKKVKPFGAFNEHGVRRGRRELKSGCRECLSEVTTKRYAEDADHRRVLSERKSKHYRTKRNEIRAAAKEARANRSQEEIERDRQVSQAWYQANRERVYAANAAWRARNPDRHRELTRTGAARRRAINPEPIREAGRRAISRRRARLRNLPTEPYTVEMIIERDGTRCVLCGDELDFTVSYPEELAPTREHLECLSWPDTTAGDVLSNVALSHWGCNNRRRDRPHPAAARKRAELLAVEQELPA